VNNCWRDDPGEAFFPKPAIATPFDVFLSKIAGQRFVYEENGYKLEAYLYDGRICVTDYLEPT
jgi:hypothetical protein